MKDLTNANSLDQIKWIFDGAKKTIGKDGKAFKETMEKAIENLKIDKKITQKFGKKSPDELKDMILDNFEKIFDLK
ncbi:hypothetical protein EDM00_06335 [Ornithobacterium rhinotracheale]|uniref:hypothetical protein n=1 Tax=Ornithobacterium rhinotracheale TaxID=28251 RepID=UPI00129CB3A5|nr:hypothetical protein [Ornithobacterium rhinotracheale]MRI63606.1 hypothetical protein [Ornithobacterium rhinotracheale]